MSGRQDTGARPAGDRTTTTASASAPTGSGATAGTAPATTVPLIPTQAGHAVSAPVPVVPAPVASVTAAPVVPAPALPLDDAPPLGTAPEPDLQPAPQPALQPDQQSDPQTAPARSHARQVVALLTAGAVLVAAGGVWAVQQERGERAEAQRAAQSRVDSAYSAVAPELAAGRVEGLVAGTAVVTALRADAAATGRAAVDAAHGTLAASAQAGDAPRGALQDAIGGATGALDAPAVSLTTVRASVAAIAAPQQAVLEAQAAWQAAEDARIAAEAAAAQAAAQAAAARSAARSASSGTTTRRSMGTGAGTSTGRSVGTSSGGAPSAPAADAPAPAGLPMAGSEASSGDVGAALNAHRAANGLGALSIVRSGSRVEHAMQMAASDSIWHSGTRAGSPKARPEIVGRVSPGNATRMIAAYAASSGHNQQMLGNYSTAYIGAVSSDGWLYTSITFG
ncbi:CAP domain-containing protein [Cellulomonas phragmiteti]|uniref:CAP domain-containing protein n=1 Tax=Cellulomonas phragmiteti TaxID=478780 RepID=UPI0019427263|nr:hypothetical protein [Cellulomonas phragmiteti]